MLKLIKTKPQLFWLAIVTLGLNLCSSLQLANLSSIFKFLGASSGDIPLLWIAPPLTGLIIQPLIGQISDDTNTRFGKRRPYIVGWGLLAVVAFISLPFFNSLLIAILLTWLMGICINGSTEGLRALTGDITSSNDQAKAFAMQAILGGVGAGIGAGLPYFMDKTTIFFKVDNALTAGTLPLSLKLAFIIAGIALLIVIVIPIRHLKEKTVKRHTAWLKHQHQHHHITLVKRIEKIFLDLYHSLVKMPQRFRSICLIHALSWGGIFMMWLYFTLALAQNVYHLPFIADTSGNTEYAKILQQATLDTSFYSTIYQYVSVVYALLLFFLPASIKPMPIHAASLLLGGIGMAAAGFVRDPLWLELCMVGVGIMWGSMIVLPYAIALQVLPKGKIGVYLGIFNISITAPQLLCGLLLGTIYETFFRSHASYILLLGGLLLSMSGFLWWRQSRITTAIAQRKESAAKAIPVPVVQH